MGPTGVIGPVGFRIPWLEVAAARALEGACTIVRAEKEQRVLPHALGLELGDDAADVLIHHLHHRGEHLHPACLPRAILFAEAVPRGDVRGAFAERKLFRDEPALELLRITRGAQLIPTAIVPPGTFFHIRLRRVQRVMRRVEGDVQKKRILHRRRFIQKLQRKIAHRVRGIKRSTIEHLRHVVFFAVVSKRVVPREKITRAGEMPPVALKSKLRWLFAQVPFADHRSRVARLAQHLGNRRSAAEARAAGLIAVQPRQQTHP